MADVLLFHHSCGLTSGVLAFAAVLSGAGHTPDRFDGATFDDIEAGVAHAQHLDIRGRAVRIADELDPGLVYAGFSLGVVPAQMLAGAELLLHPGDRHLFADSSLPSYDADAAAPLTGRVLAFLAAR